jgi:hypothetical protein
MTEKKEERNPQRSPKEWPAVSRQSKALEEIGAVLDSEEPVGDKLKKIVQEHTEACDEIKEKLADHKADTPEQAPSE